MKPASECDNCKAPLVEGTGGDLWFFQDPAEPEYAYTFDSISCLFEFIRRNYGARIENERDARLRG